MRACLCIQEDKEGEKEGERECSMLTFIVYRPPQLMSKMMTNVSDQRINFMHHEVSLIKIMITIPQRMSK